MNKQETEAMGWVPGRAPSDVVWNRIEKHLNKKAKGKALIPEWAYAVAVFSLIMVVGIVAATFFT